MTGLYAGRATGSSKLGSLFLGEFTTVETSYGSRCGSGTVVKACKASKCPVEPLVIVGTVNMCLVDGGQRNTLSINPRQESTERAEFASIEIGVPDPSTGT